MDRERALGYLPPLYARALTLEAQGRSWAEIARELEVDPHAVGPLLALASAKLKRLLADPDPQDRVPRRSSDH